MNKTIKGFLIGVVTTAVFTTSGFALASSNYFRDNGWWTPAAEWAKDHGLMSGVADGYFGGDQTVTRGQLAQVLKNLADTGAITINKSQAPTQAPILQNKIYNINETFTDGKFSITLVRIYKKTNEVTVCEFEFKNDSTTEVEDYTFGQVNFGHNNNHYPKSDGGVLWYSDTDTSVSSYQAQDKGRVKLQFVSELDGFNFEPDTLTLKGNGKDIKWNIKTN
jgi:hypothetical protein